MGKGVAATCDDCYFKRAGLCAMPLAAPCPTFRYDTGGAPARPKQAPLVPRPLSSFVTRHAAA